MCQQRLTHPFDPSSVFVVQTLQVESGQTQNENGLWAGIMIAMLDGGFDVGLLGEHSFRGARSAIEKSLECQGVSESSDFRRYLCQRVRCRFSR